MENETKKQCFVVGTGLNEGGSVAVRTAYELWKRLERVELHLVYAVEDPGKDLAALDGKLEEAMAQLRDHVMTSVEGLDIASDDLIQPVGHVRIGDAAEVICQLSADVQADLIVVGAHSKRGLRRLVLGSVSDEVARTAHTPVMVARTKDFSSVRATSSILPPRADQDMNAPQLSSRLSFAPTARSSHVPGFI